MNTLDSRKSYHAVAAAVVAALAGAALQSARAADGDWTSYNKTLTSDRYSPLDEIKPDNVSGLKEICTYDTGTETGFQTGPLMVDGVMYLTTEFDTIAVDAGDCKERWRVHEDVMPSALKVNRGLAYLDGSLFRGLQDGRVVAYSAKDGKKLWESRIADPSKGESVPAAPIAWSGLVFIGNAGGDNYGVKGRMYALDAKTGKQVWEFYLVPKEHPAQGGASHSSAAAASAATSAEGRASAEARSSDAHQASPQKATQSYEEQLAASWGNDPDVPITGGATWASYTLDPDTGLLYVPGGNPAPDFVPALRPGSNLLTDSVVVLDARTGEYRAHYQLVPEDFHDWDVAAAPVLVKTASGKRLMAVAPKDGHLYGYDLDSGERLYQVPITTIENAKAPLSREGTHFCPGTQGGVEWNGPAYDPDTRLIYTGAVDWCSTVMVADPDKVKSVSVGQPWSGSASEKNMFGAFDPTDRWAGWLYASDAETGNTAWRFKAPAPLMSGVTPTAGGIVFFGDMMGTAYALDAKSGEKLWSQDLGGAVGGGVISYEAGGQQRVAFAAGMTSPIWPTTKTTAKVAVFGLGR
ncbi:MAG TPA: PQQ-binding-like beta-propeller repeat protein [Gammaproteobacteria bacterium]|nr:PQQ-binding-like beta-propeller repeat protein [Gammaproteobacteria bacterium]